MASNEDRARLCGWELRLFTDDELSRSRWAGTSDMKQLGAPAWFAKDGVYGRVPPYDISRDACAELRAFVRARGKMREFCGHILQIVAPALNIGACPIERIFDLLDATPAQQTAAFDAVFADELSRIE